jgi:hypothetical protein
LWNSTIDRWIAGVSGSESTILLAGGDGVISSSAQLGDLNQFTSSTNTRLGLLETSTGSLNTFSSSTLTRLVLLEISTGSLNTFSSSTLTRLGLLETSTGSLNLFTASAYVSFSLMTSSIDVLEDRVNYIYGIGGLGGGNPLTPLNEFSASINTFTTSVNSRLSNIEATTSSYETTGRGIISGSSQVTPLLPTGVVSGSGQLTNYETVGRGIVSGSSQITPLLPTGTVSGSQQILLSDTLGGGVGANVQFFSLGIGMVASGNTGRIDASGDIVAYSTSDERLKENIQPIQNALSKVETISGNEYNWKNEFEYIHGFKGNDVGVIAQEIQKVLPEAIHQRENGYLGVNYEKIIPLLIQSIKELSAKVKELENK